MIKRIIYHWTAGTYRLSYTDLLHYHFIVDDIGKVWQGVYSVQDNENCMDGVYAAHTGGGNTGSIGIAFAGMYGFKSQFNIGKYPLTQKQLESGFKLGAELCKKYKLNLKDPLTIQTHYGFGVRNPKSASSGKIDIVYMPPFPKITKNQIEDFIRNKVEWYFERL